MAGPAQWANHYPTCGGSRQSPIDITTTTGGNVATRSLTFSGECGNFNLTQTDETFKASVVGGSCAASANEVSYNMAQFHIHAPSEHTLDGKPLDGEVHFVHSNADGSALMVVGIFLQVANGGTTDPWMVSVLDGMEAVTPAAPTMMSLGSYANQVNANAVRTYNYPGSLTTPGCDEIVDWWVVQQPMSISSADFTRLQTQLKELHVTDNGNNARPEFSTPIDITTATGDNVATRSLSFSGECGTFNLTQTDDTFKASVVGVPPPRSVMNGKPLDGEVHFVHRVMQTVLRFLDVVNSGKTDPFMVGSYSKLVNANSNRLYNYPGSLTTPGCDEIVDWWVVQTPISVSSNDFKRLQTQLKELNVTDNGKNARPILPLDGRKII
ncbi:hypothetical protein JG687_00019215, partial [Phytophthora cactorum]